MQLAITLEAVAAGPAGRLVLARAPCYDAPTRPVAVLLHGALGAAGVLAACLPVFAAGFEPVLCDLPGHGRSPPVAAPSVELFGRAVAAAVEARFPGRPVLLVGESLGGLVALDAAARLPGALAVVAVDPPLSTAKQWHVGAAFHRCLAENPGNRFLAEFAWNVFGIRADTAVIEERLYYPLLERVRRPALLLTGDVPLGLPRPMEAVACCLDAVDRFIVERQFAGTALRVVPGTGHVALREKPQDCYAAIRCFLGERGLAA